MWATDPNSIDIDLDGSSTEVTPTMFGESLPTSGNVHFCYICGCELAKLPDGMIYQDNREYTDLNKKKHSYVLSFCAWCRRCHLAV